MKKGIETLIEGVINEASEHQDLETNVAEHLIQDAENLENGYHFYLTDEEIEEYETWMDSRTTLENEIAEFINLNYDMTFAEWLD